MSINGHSEPQSFLVWLFLALMAPFSLRASAQVSNPPETVCSNTLLEMGSTTVGTLLVRSFLIQNPDGDHAVRIHVFSAYGPGFAVQPPPETIPAGGSVRFTVTLQAESSGSYRLGVAAYLATDPESGLDPRVSCVVEGEVTAPGS